MKEFKVTIFNRFSPSEKHVLTIEAEDQKEAERRALSGGLVNYESGWGVLCSKEVIRAEPGSISHGTLRNEDLFPAFVRCLFTLDSGQCREFEKANPNLLQALCDKECGIPTDWWDSEEAAFVMEELSDLLDGYAPEGHYFGAHPGDGSDFGFWPCENA